MFFLEVILFCFSARLVRCVSLSHVILNRQSFFQRVGFSLYMRVKHGLENGIGKTKITKFFILFPKFVHIVSFLTK